jgi:hypothetical protein
VGRLHVQCVVTVGGKVNRATTICTGALHLTDGLISLVAVVAGDPTTVTATITGGTLAYEGARGDFASVQHKNNTSTDTLHLLP